MPRIILASQSPRRKQILAAMGVEFEAIPSQFDEYLDDARDPELVAKELALGKALDVAEKYPDAYVIGSDTIVTVNGRQLGKPATASEAHEMLRSLAGGPNYVTTGVAIVYRNDNVRLTNVATAAVYFKEYDKAAIAAYVATDDPLDKAGGYGIQHHLCKELIEKIEGDTDIIVGFPTKVVGSLLKKCGIASASIDEEVLYRAINE